MAGLIKCICTLFLVSLISTIIFGISTIWNSRNACNSSQGPKLQSDFLPPAWRRSAFTSVELAAMSSLGKWLLSPEGTSPPEKVNTDKKIYTILIWQHGPFLERRHIRRFSQKQFSPWEGCSVNNCILKYETVDLDRADVVIFHLHLTKSPEDLPERKRTDQRWIFLTDESPMHTFLYSRKQKISDYNGLFNWSMTYRMDSDVPVPYGRTILAKPGNAENEDSLLRKDLLRMKKKKLVAVMGSNCGGSNSRWKYVGSLKEVLGNDLDIFGRCLDGNATACPGHFDRDCPVLDSYKFYLSFENANCKEYLTEKVWWHGYHKLAVPIIMGAPKKDCERLLPPGSFLHVEDFANPLSLATYLRYVYRNEDEYWKYHQWRKYYRVINEHGYFGSGSKHYCRVCEALNYNSLAPKVYDHLEDFWSKEKDCSV